jgi:hypothetical protein
MKRTLTLVLLIFFLGVATPARANHSNDGFPHKDADTALVDRLQADDPVYMWAPYYVTSYDGRYYWEQRSGWNSFGTVTGSEPATPYIKFSTNCGPDYQDICDNPNVVGLAYVWGMYPNVYFIWIRPANYGTGKVVAHEIGHHVIPAYGICCGDSGHGVYPYKGVMRVGSTWPFSTTGKSNDHWICKELSSWCL